MSSKCDQSFDTKQALNDAKNILKHFPHHLNDFIRQKYTKQKSLFVLEFTPITIHTYLQFIQIITLC